MTFGSTRGKSWTEVLPTKRGAPFTGRTFSRFHFAGDRSRVPAVGEIWATGEHAVEAHAHESDELLYVLSGAIEVDGNVIVENETVFIPRGTAYRARVVAPGGSRVLRIEFPGLGARPERAEYDARVWKGPLTEAGVPAVGTGSSAGPAGPESGGRRA